MRIPELCSLEKLGRNTPFVPSFHNRWHRAMKFDFGPCLCSRRPRAAACGPAASRLGAAVQQQTSRESLARQNMLFDE
eukprot:4159-Pleurochrysis_carterae.AAC.2